MTPALLRFNATPPGYELARIVVRAVAYGKTAIVLEHPDAPRAVWFDEHEGIWRELVRHPSEVGHGR